MADEAIVDRVATPAANVAPLRAAPALEPVHARRGCGKHTLIVVQPSDERPHVPDPGAAPGWQEAWDFTFAADDLSIAGYARLAVVPEERSAWVWVAVVGVDLPLLAVRHHELDVPRGWPQEVRGEGLWCGVVCETPLDHWSVGVEAFAISFENPLDAWDHERGDLVPLGFDLEWEDAGTTANLHGGYRRAGSVHGEVLIGDASVDVSAPGWRAHTWRAEEWDQTEAVRTSDAAVPQLLSPVLVPPHRVLRGVIRVDDSFEWAEWRGAEARDLSG